MLSDSDSLFQFSHEYVDKWYVFHIQVLIDMHLCMFLDTSNYIAPTGSCNFKIFEKL